MPRSCKKVQSIGSEFEVHSEAGCRTPHPCPASSRKGGKRAFSAKRAKNCELRTRDGVNGSALCREFPISGSSWGVCSSMNPGMNSPRSNLSGLPGLYPPSPLPASANGIPHLPTPAQTAGAENAAFCRDRDGNAASSYLRFASNYRKGPGVARSASQFCELVPSSSASGYCGSCGESLVATALFVVS